MSISSLPVNLKKWKPEVNGMQKILTDKMILSGEASRRANIQIYNQAGVEILRLANNLMISSGEVIERDGQTESHRKAQPGIHIVQVYLFSLDGRKKHIKSPCVITDKL